MECVILNTGIYMFFDTRDNTCMYIGQSRDINLRKSKHIQLLKSGKHKRSDFVQWYRFNSQFLGFKVISVCEDSLLNSEEINAFNEFKPLFFGQIPSDKDKFRHSDSTKEKISRTVRNNTKESRVLTVCPACGIEFEDIVSKNKKSCSVACSGLVRNNKTNSIDLIELKEKYDSGMSLHSLGSYYGFSYRTIHSLMVKNNIPRRRPGSVMVSEL